MIIKKMNFKETLICVLYIMLVIATNMFGCFLSANISIPLYFDSILTISVVALFGLLPGLLCAILSNLMLTVLFNSSLLFTFCHILTAFLAWIVFETSKKSDSQKKYYAIETFLWAGLFSGLSNALLGNIISDIFLASKSGRIVADLPVQGIYVATENLVLATYFGGALENLADKTISAILSFGAYRLFILMRKKLRLK